MGEIVGAIIALVALAWFNAGAFWWTHKARQRLAAVRADAVRAHVIRLASLDEHRDSLLRLKASLEPQEALERYAGRLRDQNEVHRLRERPLVQIADAAKVVVNGAFVQRDRLHPTAHVRLDQFDALKDALKAWGGTVIAVPGEVAPEKSNNLSGPSDEGELPEAG